MSHQPSFNWHASTKTTSNQPHSSRYFCCNLGRPLPLEITLDPFHWTTTCLRFWWSILNGTSEQLLEALPVKMGWGTPEARHLMSNEKGAPGCLGHTGDLATQLYRDYSKPWNQYKGKLDGIFRGLNVLWQYFWYVCVDIYLYIYEIRKNRYSWSIPFCITAKVGCLSSFWWFLANLTFPTWMHHHLFCIWPVF